MNKKCGFTLLEVVIALAVVSIAVVALVQAVSGNIKSAAHLNDKMLAQWLGENHLASLLLSPTPPAEGQTEGKVEFAKQKWRWVQQVSATQMPNKLLLRIEIKIFPENGENSLVTLQTYVSPAMASCDSERICRGLSNK